MSINQEDINRLRPSNTKSPETRREKPSHTLEHLGATALVLLAIAGVVGIDAYANRAPQFSETKTEYVAEPGDGVNAAAKHVEGISNVDIRRVVEHIEADPANANTFKDNRLDPGEVVVIPESVKR